jgi:hypothetical protein
VPCRHGARCTAGAQHTPRATLRHGARSAGAHRTGRRHAKPGSERANGRVSGCGVRASRTGARNPSSGFCLSTACAMAPAAGVGRLAGAERGRSFAASRGCSHARHARHAYMHARTHARARARYAYKRALTRMSRLHTRLQHARSTHAPAPVHSTPTYTHARTRARTQLNPIDNHVCTYSHARTHMRARTRVSAQTRTRRLYRRVRRNAAAHMARECGDNI